MLRVERLGWDGVEMYTISKAVCMLKLGYECHIEAMTDLAAPSIIEGVHSDQNEIERSNQETFSVDGVNPDSMKHIIYRSNTTYFERSKTSFRTLSSALLMLSLIKSSE